MTNGSEQNDDKTRTHIVLTQGTMVGHYRIVEKIGAGGMGEVFLADDTELDRQVALKFLPQHMCTDENCRARFKRDITVPIGSLSIRAISRYRKSSMSAKTSTV